MNPVALKIERGRQSIDWGKKKAFTAKPKTHIQINSPGVHHYAKLKYCGLI